MAILQELYQSVIDGNMNGATEGVTKALKQGIPAAEILNQGLINAMTEVGRLVATQPPWSIATSMMTLPGFISFRSSRSISRGALAPGTNTAPITRSARRSCSRTMCRSESI